MIKRILLKGPVLTRSGYGEQSRFALRSLRSRPDLFEVFIQPLQWGKTSWLNEQCDERLWIDQTIEKTIAHLQQGGTFDMSMQVTIPNEWEKLAPINIGYTAGMETTAVAPGWLAKANEIIDKIIVVSDHSRDTFAASTYNFTNEHGQTGNLTLQKPIESVNYPVKSYDELPELDLGLTTDFNFLAVAQYGPRKNLKNTIKWFMEEFKNESVGLVLKTSLMKNCYMDRLQLYNEMRTFIASFSREHTCKVYLLHGDMTDAEMHALYAHKDISALLTLTHGEGFGLPIFEAAYSGVPVIAPGWSGQLDFLCVDGEDRFYNVGFDIQPIPKEAIWEGVVREGTMWAYPREGSAKKRMRECYDENKEQRAERFAEYAAYLHETFTEENLYAQFVAETIDEPEPEVLASVDEIPMISLITSVFDAEEHIEQLLEDVTRQSIFEERCEWLIYNVNPEGSDAEEKLIQKYVEKYPDNIIYKRVSEDPGVYGIWNLGIQESTGEFITNINCDDRRNPIGLYKQASTLVKTPDVDLVYNDSYVVHEANTLYEDIDPSTTQRYNFEQFSQEAMMRGNLPHNNPMWRKTLHDKNGYFDSTYKSAGDWEFWLRCTFAGAKFKKHSEVLGVYYFNPEGISTNTENESWKREEEKKVFQKYYPFLQR